MTPRQGRTKGYAATGTNLSEFGYTHIYITITITMITMITMTHCSARSSEGDDVVRWGVVWHDMGAI